MIFVSELDLIIEIPTVKRSDRNGEVSYFMEMLSSIVNEADHRKGLKNFNNIVLTKQIHSLPMLNLNCSP